MQTNSSNNDACFSWVGSCYILSSLPVIIYISNKYSLEINIIPYEFYKVYLNSERNNRKFYKKKYKYNKEGF